MSFTGVTSTVNAREFVLLRALIIILIFLFILGVFVASWFILFCWGSGIKVKFTSSAHHFQALEGANVHTQCGPE